jgi:predicted RecA/RadA family phage recombinase
MQNYVQPGSTINLVAPYAVASGAGALVGTVFGVATQAIANGASGEFMVEGCFALAKASGAWTQGATLYWDNTAKNVTTVSTSNTKIGVAMRAEASGNATGRVRLNGAF